MNETLQTRVQEQDEEIQQLRILADRMNVGSSGPGSLPLSMEEEIASSEGTGSGMNIYPPLPSSEVGTPHSHRGGSGPSSYASGGEAFHAQMEAQGHVMNMMNVPQSNHPGDVNGLLGSVNGKGGMTRLSVGSDDDDGPVPVISPAIANGGIGIPAKMEDVDIDVHIAQ